MNVTLDLSKALAGRYVIERELGAGGMATVYLAHDVKHERKVAIKVLKPELAAVLGAERFIAEIKTTAALQHPHILPLFDSGTAEGQLYYVMPYIKGETIREKLNRETQFGVDEAVRIAREVADALDYAHRHGVIHRDIKPENVLLDPISGRRSVLLTIRPRDLTAYEIFRTSRLPTTVDAARTRRFATCRICSQSNGRQNDRSNESSDASDEDRPVIYRRAATANCRKYFRR